MRGGEGGRKEKRRKEEKGEREGCGVVIVESEKKCQDFLAAAVSRLARLGLAPPQPSARETNDALTPSPEPQFAIPQLTSLKQMIAGSYKVPPYRCFSLVSLLPVLSRFLA